MLARPAEERVRRRVVLRRQRRPFEEMQCTDYKESITIPMFTGIEILDAERLLLQRSSLDIRDEGGN